MISQRLRSGSLAVIGAAALLAATTAPAGSQGGGLDDGEWRVVFFHQAYAELSGLDVQYTSHGSADIGVDGGFAGGGWQLSVQSFLPETGTVSNAEAIGTLTGDAVTQTLDFVQLTATEPTIGLTITLTADDLPESGGGVFTAAGSGCNARLGYWSIPFNESSLEGEYIATPLRAVGPAEAPDAEFRDNGLELIAQARAGELNPIALRLFLEDAERIAGNISERRPGCGGAAGRAFANGSTLLVDLVMSETGYALQDISRDQFVDLYQISLRSGLFDFNAEAKTVWEQSLRLRFANVITEGTVSDWEYWLPIAEQLGEEDTAGTLASLICEESEERDCDEEDQ